MSTFKKQLEAHLKERGMSAAELARRSGVPPQTLCDWLSGRSPRKIENVKKVSVELGVSLEDLFFGKNARPPSSLRETLLRMFKKVGRPDALTDLGSDLFRASDVARGLISYSDSWEWALGWGLRDLQARSYQEIIHPDDYEETLRQAEREILTGRSHGLLEHRLLHRNGKYLTFRTMFFADAKLEYLLSISRP